MLLRDFVLVIESSGDNVGNLTLTNNNLNMKRSLFLIICAVIVLGSCKKKPSSTYCYVCNRYQTTYSSYEVLAIPNHLYAIDTVCHMNDGEIALYVQTHSYYDTTKNSHDTLIYVDNSVQCDVQ